MQFYLASSTTVVFSYKAHRDFSPHFKPRPSHKPKPTKLSPVTLQWDWYKAEVYRSKDPLGFGLKQTRPPTHIILEAKKKERGKNSLDSRSWNSWAACMFYLIIVFILLSHEIYLLISGFCGQKMMKAGADRKCVCVCVCVCAACWAVTMATQTNTGHWCGMLQQVIISSKLTFDPFHAPDDIWLHLPAVTESLGRVSQRDVTRSASDICFLWCCRLADAGVQVYAHNMIFKKRRNSLCYQTIKKKKKVSQRYRVCICYLRELCGGMFPLMKQTDF